VDKRARYHLPDSVQMYRDELLLTEENTSEVATMKTPLRMPVSFRGSEMAAFSFGGSGGLTGSLPGLSKETTGWLVDAMCTELNREYSVNLDAKPDLEAGKNCAARPLEGRDQEQIIIAGSSHASRLAEQIGQDRPDIVDLSCGGWRLTDATAGELAEDLTEQIGQHNKCAVILQLFDNSIFCGKMGNKLRPALKIEGKYHIEGELAVVEREQMKYLFETAAPIFKATKNVPTFVLGPVPRYVMAPCCEEACHVTNMSEEDFTAKIAVQVRDLGRHLRQLVWHKRWRNVFVINTAEIMGIGGSLSIEEIRLRLDDMLELWGEDDPVHPSPQAYANLAANLVDQIKGKCCLMEDSAEPGRGVKRPREEHVGRRPDWTAESETSVGRLSGRRDESWGRKGRSGNHPGRDFPVRDKSFRSSARGSGGGGGGGRGGRGGGGRNRFNW